MAKLWLKNGVASVILRVFIRDTTKLFGEGKSGLMFNSPGLVIATIADNEAAATVYAQAAGNIETIATLGTFAAPTTNKARFKEVDVTNLPGLYEIQIANARWAVSGARSLIVSLPRVSGLDTAPVNAEIQLTAVDPQDATAFGITRLDAAVSSAGNAPTVEEIHAVILGVLTAETFPEPAPGAPPAALSILGRLQHLYADWRNKRTTTGTADTLYADDGTTPLNTATLSDDGSTFTKSERSS